MILLNINGPINSGKSTVAKIVSGSLEKSLFIEVDDLLSDDEQDVLGLDFMAGILERLARLEKKIRQEKHNFDVIIFAYPMNKNNYELWKKLEEENSRFVNVTLSPSLEKCLTNRGTRELTEWETNRIKQMYAEKFNEPENSDLLINNDDLTPQETATKIIAFLKENFEETKGE